MVTLIGEHTRLRALEPSDIEILERTENDEELWHLSNSLAPLSRYQLEQYILNASADIFEAKQLRLVISNNDGRVVGFIDLFEFDPIHQRAGVGIVISKTEDRRKGYGGEALKLLIKYAFSRLKLHQLYCHILESNSDSIRLFEAYGFTKVGLKRDWRLLNGAYENEWLLQLINTKDVY